MFALSSECASESSEMERFQRFVVNIDIFPWIASTLMFICGWLVIEVCLEELNLNSFMNYSKFHVTFFGWLFISDYTPCCLKHATDEKCEQKCKEVRLKLGVWQGSFEKLNRISGRVAQRVTSRKVPGSNSTWRSIGLRDPSSLRGSRFHFGRKLRKCSD